jgi:hypothetical protein
MHVIQGHMRHRWPGDESWDAVAVKRGDKGDVIYTTPLPKPGLTLVDINMIAEWLVSAKLLYTCRYKHVAMPIHMFACTNVTNAFHAERCIHELRKMFMAQCSLGHFVTVREADRQVH